MTTNTTNTANTTPTSATNESTADIATKPLITVADFYHYLDALFELDSDSDTLFAGGYLRGFFSLVATDFGDESQVISAALVEAVTEKAKQAKLELSPQDYAIVTNFWLATQQRIVLQ
ncbi:YfcL family protein [Colwellia ponticola]|uniref:YfcL family protein n=1 Tax=Colwellia ponticola TaxID=2304625 RepID=A0A8H2PJ80_9GAMM|nr:YfcL family protein [Colwellia ponticola]TMM42479.1 YfcL family protein [Colwellia ponticola]